MKLSDIAAMRMYNQYLSRPTFTNASVVVSHLGAVQAQDYLAAKWGLGLRMKQATDRDIEKAYDSGEILRTHVMRPTWHFVLPVDIRWMLTLTAPNVKRLMASYNKKLELDEHVFAKARVVVAKALAGKNYLTRQELKKELSHAGIETDVQRLAHIMMECELDAIICNGPRRGKQFTYALLDEWVPAASEKFDRDKAIAKLAKMYFTSHGPAQVRDFSWWSGLSMKDATMGLDLIASELDHETIVEKTYWFLPVAHEVKSASSKAYLLSIFDEYTIAYNDRSALGGERFIETFIAMGNALVAVIIVDGLVVGTWKRIFKKNTIEIILRPLRDLTKKELDAIHDAAEQYGVFHSMKITLHR